MDELELGLEAAVERAQRVGARLLFPVPSRAEVRCVLDRSRGGGAVEPPVLAGMERPIHRQGAVEQVRIPGVEYVAVPPESLGGLYWGPSALGHSITEVAKVAGDRAQPGIRLLSVTAAVREAPAWASEYFDMGQARYRPMEGAELYLQAQRMVFQMVSDAGVEAIWDPAQIQVLSSDLELMRFDELENYPTDVEEFGDFEPNENTPQMVRDINVAYYLFRVKRPVCEHHDLGEAQRKVRIWLEAVWDAADGRDRGVRLPNRQVLDTLVNALSGRIEPHVGKHLEKLAPDPETQARQQSSAPDWLVLFDHVAQLRAAGDKDFCQPKALEMTCGHTLPESQDQGGKVRPKRFVDALNIATSMS